MSFHLEAIKLAEHLSDPWAAAAALRPAMTEHLHRGRASWLRDFMDGGDSAAEAWTSVHGWARDDLKLVDLEATAQLVRHGRRTLAVIHGPRGLREHLIATGLGTDFSADSRTGDGPCRTWEKIMDRTSAVPALMGLSVTALIGYTDLMDGQASFKARIGPYLERYAPRP